MSKRTAKLKINESKKNAGKFYLTYDSVNGETMAVGKRRGSTIEECEEDIRHIKTYGENIENYGVARDKNDKPYAYFISPEDKDMKMHTESYEKNDGATSGIRSMIRNLENVKIIYPDGTEK